MDQTDDALNEKFGPRILSSIRDLLVHNTDQVMAAEPEEATWERHQKVIVIL